MNKIKLTLGLLCLLTVAVVLAGGSRSWAVEAPTEQTEQVVGASNTFAWAMYAEIVGGDDGNVFFSPASIHAALSMTRLGAVGRTAEQMDDVLRLMELLETGQELAPAYAGLLAVLTPDEDASYQLSVANALWGQEGYSWQEAFLADAAEGFGAGLEEVDFASDPEAARGQINQWVEDQTNEKIQDLMPAGAVNAATRMVLANAIYFKGDWAEPFDVDNTRDETFRKTASDTVQVPMMHQNEDFDYNENELLQVLRLPYADDELSMIIFLPKAVDGLADVEAWLIADGPDAALEGLREQGVNVSLPKFRMTWEGGLGDLLSAMGMTDAFDGAEANFDRLSEQARDEGLCIGVVVHKAFVDVSEEGTEAAAATAISMVATSVPAPPVEFRADHPFVFMIRHEATGAILFVGRVVDPPRSTGPARAVRDTVEEAVEGAVDTAIDTTRDILD